MATAIASMFMRNFGIKRSAILSVLLVFTLLFTCISCAFESEPKEELTELSKYDDYKDIPGVTEEEIAAIESIKKDNHLLTYAMVRSTEAFYNTEGDLDGYSVLLCQSLSQLFGIEFKVRLVEWEELIHGLADHRYDFTGELSKNAKNQSTYFMTDTMANRSIYYYKLNTSSTLAATAKTRPLEYAFLHGSTAYDRLVESSEEAFNAHYVSNYTEAYQLIKDGTVDAFIDHSTAEYVFDAYPEILASEFLPLIYVPVSLSTQNESLKPIIDVMEKYLASDGVVVPTQLLQPRPQKLCEKSV
ncbi:ABC-type amino acid transport substrate-binding protein [Clostridiales Family XIII bacterium PM5-7]